MCHVLSTVPVPVDIDGVTEARFEVNSLKSWDPWKFCTTEPDKTREQISDIGAQILGRDGFTRSPSGERWRSRAVDSPLVSLQDLIYVLFHAVKALLGINVPQPDVRHTG